MTHKRLNNLEDLEALLRLLHEVQTIDGIGFDMNRDYSGRECTIHPCGTACCIGGWVQTLNPEVRKYAIADAVYSISPKEFDLREATALCYPDLADDGDDMYKYYYAPALMAAYAVKIFRETGKADWVEAERLAKEELTSAQ
jgi:hypothetical protein